MGGVAEPLLDRPAELGEVGPRVPALVGVGGRHLHVVADVDPGDQGVHAHELAGHVDDAQVPAAVPRDEEGDVRRAWGLAVDGHLAEGLELERLFGGGGGESGEGEEEKAGCERLFHRGLIVAPTPLPGEAPSGRWRIQSAIGR